MTWLYLPQACLPEPQTHAFTGSLCVPEWSHWSLRTRSELWQLNCLPMDEVTS
jgi:hypothetical protein